jgi:hypothetical protein
MATFLSEVTHMCLQRRTTYWRAMMIERSSFLLDLDIRRAQTLKASALSAQRVRSLLSGSLGAMARTW